MPRIIDTAEIAAERALLEMYSCIRNKEHFKLEAGAGAGKTYSLIKGLKLLINEQGKTLSKRAQKVACITYTNVATNEINARTDSHPVIHASTIHGFCWSLIQDHQLFIWEQISSIHSKWQEMLSELPDDDNEPRKVCYSTGRRRLTDSEAQLSHDDILPLMVLLLGKAKFRRNLSARYPVIFIDEYQDTNKEFAAALVEHFIDTTESSSSPLIGLFGDSWQKIYRTGAGVIEHPNLVTISKQANFRSASKIIDSLNNIRPTLPQLPKESAPEGEVTILHSNNWIGERQTGAQWKGDLPLEESHRALQITKDRLSSSGWDFSSNETRILMLTHKVMASEQGYEMLAGAFSNNDALINLENAHISFMTNILVPAISAFESGRYGEMFSLLGSNAPKIKRAEDKSIWRRNFNSIVEVKHTGTIGDVLELLKSMSPSILQTDHFYRRKVRCS